MERTLGITIRADTGTQMDVASGGGPKGGTSSPSGDKSSDDKKKDEKQKDTSLKKLIGIDVSIAAMLKQSQIFTGFLGSVFQLIGMLVDVILAPLAPYLFKLVEVVASWIPKVGTGMQTLVDYLKRLFDKTVEWVDSWSSVSVGAGDLVKKGFQLVSIQGMAALIGEQFAIKFSNIGKGWTFTDLFEKADIKQQAIIKHITAAFGEEAKGIKGAVGGIFRAVFKSLTAGWGRKLMTIVKTFAKGAKVLGTIGMIIGIAFEINDIINSFKEGNVGEAVVKIALLVIGLGVPIAIGLAFGAIPALIAGVVVAGLALLWEYAVPPEIKEKIFTWIENLFTEIKQVFADMFNLGEGSIFSKIINGLMKLFFIGPTLIMALLSMVLSEGIKRTINDGIRNLADTLVNGLIGIINNILSFVTNMIPTEILGIKIPGADKLKNFQIGEVDFSNFNLMMGTDTRTEIAIGHAGMDIGAAGNMAMYAD